MRFIEGRTLKDVADELREQMVCDKTLESGSGVGGHF